jgi:hypothetical protein
VAKTRAQTREGQSANARRAERQGAVTAETYLVAVQAQQGERERERQRETYLVAVQAQQAQAAGAMHQQVRLLL